MDGPLFPALFSLNMLIGSDDGHAFARVSMEAMRTEDGLHGIYRLPYDSPKGSAVLIGHE